MELTNLRRTALSRLRPILVHGPFSFLPSAINHSNILHHRLAVSSSLCLSMEAATCIQTTRGIPPTASQTNRCITSVSVILHAVLLPSHCCFKLTWNHRQWRPATSPVLGKTSAHTISFRTRTYTVYLSTKALLPIALLVPRPRSPDE